MEELIENGSLEEIKEFVNTHPEWNVNQHICREGSTVLLTACIHDRVEVVKFLLSLPEIDINVTTADDYTPFAHVCNEGKVELAKLFLKDPRLNINYVDYTGRSALWFACEEGHTEIVKWILACGRNLTAANKKGLSYEGKHGSIRTERTPLEIAEKKNRKDIVKILRSFLEDKKGTRRELRQGLGLDKEAEAAEVFATVVFLCDGYLDVKKGDHRTRAARFFAISVQLPLELQMFLANVKSGLNRNNIHTKDSEPKFRELASEWKSGKK